MKVADVAALDEKEVGNVSFYSVDLSMMNYSNNHYIQSIKVRCMV